MAETIKGLKALEKKLKALDASTNRKILRAATKAALQPAARRAKQLIPKGSRGHKTYKGRLVAPGFASRNIVSFSFAISSGVLAQLGVRKEALYATQFVEVGKSKKHKQRPHPWLGPAFKQTREQQMTKLVQALEKNIDKQLKKAGR